MMYIVVNEDGMPSWNTKADASEIFSTFKAAEQRAKELAEGAAGKTIGIYELVATAVAPVTHVKVTFVSTTLAKMGATTVTPLKSI